MKTITGGMAAALAGSQVRLGFLFEAEFISYTLRLSSGQSDLSWGGYTWQGNGWFLGMDSLSESEGIESTALEVVLTGVPTAIITLILSSFRQNLSGKLYLAAFDTSWGIISDPLLIYSGGLDVPSVIDSTQQTAIRLRYESQLIKLRQPSDLRYTDEAQKALFPGDRGFQFLAGTADWDGYWGKKKKPPTNNRSSASRARK